MDGPFPSPGVKVSIPSQAGTLFGLVLNVYKQGTLHRLNALSGGHPLRTTDTTQGGCESNFRLNTLSGGHPLRTSRCDRRPLRPRGLNTLSGGHPLRTGGCESNFPITVVVSIPSQAGTLFGRRCYETLTPGLPGLNTLSGGHPLRTTVVVFFGLILSWVSIPSQAGTLFGQEAIMKKLFLLAVSIPSQAGTLFGPIRVVHQQGQQKESQYPLRRAPSSDHSVRRRPNSRSKVSIPSQAGTLFGPKQRARTPPESLSLNTLSGGHPLRTVGGLAVVHLCWWSQYPLRRAPSSDVLLFCETYACDAVSIPSQAGTLFGLESKGITLKKGKGSQYPLRRAPSSDIPSVQLV